MPTPILDRINEQHALREALRAWRNVIMSQRGISVTEGLELFLRHEKIALEGGKEVGGYTATGRSFGEPRTRNAPSPRSPLAGGEHPGGSPRIAGGEEAGGSGRTGVIFEKVCWFIDVHLPSPLAGGKEAGGIHGAAAVRVDVPIVVGQ